MRRTISLNFVYLAVGSVLAASVANAQRDELRAEWADHATATTIPAEAPHPSPAMDLFLEHTGHFYGLNNEQQKRQAEAIRQLKEAQSEEQRDRARSAIRELLEKEFDEMIKGEEKSLDQLEQRLARLREQIVRRRTAKSKLVDLRLQTILNEADGLGWPGSQRADNRWSRGPITVPLIAPTAVFSPTPAQPVPGPVSK